jgi:signal transduction histidine kinase/PAS domain-containing protein
MTEAAGTLPNDRPPVTAAHEVVVPARRRFATLTRYAIAIASVAVALLLSVVMEQYVGRIIFVFFWPAVVATAVYGGLGPALLASTLSVLAVDYWFMSPRHTLHLRIDADLAPLLLFFFAASLVSTIAERRRIAEKQVADSARANADLVKQLEQQALELESQLEESQALSEELEQTTVELEERGQEAEAAAAFSRGILESISDPFVVQDADWCFRFINAAAARIFAGSGHGDSEALVGRVLWDVYPELIGTDFEREMRRAAAERVPVQFEAFYAERGNWVQLFCYPLPDGGLATQWKDISARKRAEETLHYLDRATDLLTASLDLDQRLADLAQLVVPDLADWCAIHLVDAEGKPKQVAVAHVDPAKVRWARELNRRYPPRADAPTGVPNVLRTGEPELYSSIGDEMLVAGAIDDEHLRISRELKLRSAMVVPLSARGRTFGALTLVSSDSGRRYGAEDLSLAGELARRAAFAIDNARQHQAALAAQHEAEAANQSKSQFLAAMSHELRTPLNAIGGYAQLLAMGVRGPIAEEQRADLERIQQSQRHLLGLISDILDFARIEAGKVEFRLTRVPVATLLADLQGYVDPQLKMHELTFHCDQPDPGVAVHVDPDKARQILLNLLSNSVKFTPPGGRVEVRCETRDSRVLIRVSDTGVGIAPDRFDAVFEPFVQVHRSLVEPTGGVGLGLAISRDLARGMSGDLTVESTVSVGSTFTLALPTA